ncbi:nuclear transport factor 2 family protein [Saccharopolyspora indica]|uniref:nuclear transport factor 2 family protein n=1 Tax=Saccharopolyspora indica TaxID=1229659 RepID=UPI0022EB54CD|nr:nuclear transport factor 2 family protein [Saccharopolyspora indica]MDA3645083.1 nuclear transport factor 2 family protein [Saccharopolyspora indica]
MSEPAGTAAQLVSVADQWARAIATNDLARIAEHMADEWTIVSESGISAKERFLSLIASGELTHSAMQRVGEPRITICGDVAIYVARVTNTAHYRGQRFDADEWTTDVFAWRDGRWRCVHSHITPVAT